MATLRVVGKRDDEADQPPVLIVEDVYAYAQNGYQAEALACLSLGPCL